MDPQWILNGEPYLTAIWTLNGEDRLTKPEIPSFLAISKARSIFRCSVSGASGSNGFNRLQTLSGQKQSRQERKFIALLPYSDGLIPDDEASHTKRIASLIAGYAPQLKRYLKRFQSFEHFQIAHPLQWQLSVRTPRESSILSTNHFRVGVHFWRSLG